MRPVVWIILLAYAALLAPVLTDFRGVMGDEAAYADPALRWCEGKGFTSAAWNQPPDEFWAGNVPFYTMAVAAWVKITDLGSLWGLRFFSLIAYIVGLVFWIAGCHRLGWLRSGAQQAGFLALILGSLYATAPSQYVRPESLGMLLLGFALWGQTLSRSSTRAAAAFISGFVAAWTGLQFVVAFTVFGLVWILLAARKPWKEIFSCAAGGLLGFTVLFAIYHSMGVLGVFLASTFGAGGNRSAQWHGWRDPMLWTGAAVLIVAIFCSYRNSKERAWSAAGLLAGPGLALTLFSLSKFPQYYVMLAVMPLCTAVCAVLPTMSVPWRVAAVAGLAITCVVGFPLAALMNWNAMPGRHHEALRQWTDSVLSDSQKVFADPSAYFAVQSPNRETYTQFVLDALTKGQAEDIDTAVLVPTHGLPYLQNATVLGKLEGEWQCTDFYPATWPPPTRVPRLNFLSRLSYSVPYRFEVWRRKVKVSAL